MSQELAFEATLTDRYQNTVPSPVRAALGLKKRDKVRYVIRNGKVTLQKVEGAATGDDPVVEAFLSFLEKDMLQNPGSLTPVSAELMAEASRLVDGVEIDLDAPLEDD